MSKTTAYINGAKFAQVKLGLDDQQDYSKYYPALAGLAAAGIAGPTAYRALRKVTPSMDPAINAMRAAAKDKFTRVIPTKSPSSYLAKLRDKLIYTGGDDVAYTDYAPPASSKRVPGVVRYTEPSDALHIQGDIPVGAGPGHAELLKKIQDDKWHEYEFFNKYAPEAFGKSENLRDVIKDLGHETIPSDPAAQTDLLEKLQNELRTRYGKGFLLKDTGGLQSGGIFPNDKTLFNERLKGYRAAGLENKHTEGLKNLETAYGGDIGKLIGELRDNPHYEGRVLEQLLRDPSKVMVQERLPLLEPTGKLRALASKALGSAPNYETRVHVENGKVIPDLISSRYDPAMEVVNRDMLQRAGAFAQGVVDKLPPEHRNMSFAMDVHPLQDGTFKLMESNPGGQSGFLYPDIMPLSGPKLRKAYMGNYAKPVSALAATGTALGAGGLAAGATTAGTQVLGAQDTPTRPKQKPPTRLVS